jgi:hypothetical protein
VTLDDRQLYLLADLVAERVLDGLRSPAPRPRLVDAAALARELGVGRRWVYEHRDALGAVQLGTGSKPRLRFDLEAAREAMARSRSGRSQGQKPRSDGRSGERRGTRAARLPNGLPEPGSVLAVRPRGGGR